MDNNSPSEQWIRFVFQSLSGENTTPPDCKLPVDFLIDAGALPYIDWLLVDNPNLDLHCFEEKNPDYNIGTYGPLGLMFELRLKELYAINDVFLASGVEYKVAKGMAACFNIYRGREECREMADIDLIVKPKSFRTAIHLLRTVGFELALEPISFLNFSDGQVSLKKQIGRVQINLDLHRYINFYPLHANLSRALFQNEYKNTVSNLPVTHPVMSLLWELSHQTKDKFSGDYRGLFDIVSYIRLLSDSEWERFCELYRKFGLDDAAQILSLQILHLNQLWDTKMCLRIASLMINEKEKLKLYSVRQLNKRGVKQDIRKVYFPFITAYAVYFRYSSNKFNAFIAMCLFLITRLSNRIAYNLKTISFGIKQE